MSRNTHSRSLDHHGTDAVANIALTEMIANYDGSLSLTTVLTDIIARIARLEAFHGIFSFTASAIVLKTATGTVPLSALVLKTATGTVPLSALVLKTATGSYSASAVVLKTAAASFTMSAEISS